MSTTPYMNLSLPVPGVTPTPVYGPMEIAAFTAIDSHNHTLGQGVPIPTSGLNIDEDLPFNSYSANQVRTIRFVDEASALSLPADISCVYCDGGDMYWNNGSGQAIQITAGSGLNATSLGGFGGDFATSTASAYYTSASSLFSFTSATNTYALMSFGSFTTYASGADSKGVTISAPNGLGANYGLTLPTGLPASTKIMTCDASGNVGVAYDVDNSSLQVSGNTLGIKASGVTGSLIAAATITGSKIAPTTIAGSHIVDETITNDKLAAGNSNNASCSFSITSTSYVSTGTSLSITTTGRPLLILITGISEDGNSNLFLSNVSAGGVCWGQLLFRSDTVAVCSQRFQSFTGATVTFGASVVAFIASPGATTHSIDVLAKVNATSTTFGASNCQLVAYEL